MAYFVFDPSQNGRSLVRGPFGSDFGAQRYIDRHSHNLNRPQVVELPTRDQARASRMLRAQAQSMYGTDVASRNFRHRTDEEDSTYTRN